MTHNLLRLTGTEGMQGLLGVIVQIILQPSSSPSGSPQKGFLNCLTLKMKALWSFEM